MKKHDAPALLAQYRSSGLSVAEFAAQIGVSKSTVHNWVNGKGLGKKSKQNGHARGAKATFMQVGTPETFEVEKNSVKFRIATTVDTDTLKRLLKATEQ